MNLPLTLILVTAAALGALLIPRSTQAMTETPKKPEPMLTSVPRGIRNHNPGNIEDSGIPWRGLVGNDGRYAVFDSPLNGIRALAINLYSYFDSHGLNTVRGIINRWAPSTENNTASYVSAVSGDLGVSADTMLDFKTHVGGLVRAIIKHENGYNPYSNSLIENAIQESGRI